MVARQPVGHLATTTPGGSSWGRPGLKRESTPQPEGMLCGWRKVLEYSGAGVGRRGGRIRAGPPDRRRRRGWGREADKAAGSTAWRAAHRAQQPPWPPLGQLGPPSPLAQNRQEAGHALAGPRGHGAHVEDLVEAEPVRQGVGSLAGVDDGAQRVGHAASHQQPHDRGAARLPELRQEPDCHPAQNDVEGGGEPARGVHPQQVRGRADRRPRPHDPQDQGGRARRQQRRRQGRVGAGDEQVDVRVVDPPQRGRDLRRPVPGADVVDAGVGEQQQRACQVDGAGPLQACSRGQDRQYDAGRQGQRRGTGVDPSAQPGLDGGDDALGARGRGAARGR